jgi:glycosyltransferase involved in cell wall biosynthesis
MLARTSPLNVDLAKQFAWLLRKDVREAYASPSDPGFDEWWLIKGRQEFPGWAHSGDPQALEALFAPNSRATLAGVNFEVPKIASLLAKHRPDALREFSKDGKVNNERFFSWVVVRGLAEHHLLDHAPHTFIAALDQPLPDTTAKPNDIGSPPAATLLMYLLWLMMDKATQDAKNLFTSGGRQAFLSWFFNVVKPLGLSPLVAGRWRSWLLMPIEGAPQGPEIPRFSQIAWMASTELRKQIPLEHPQDLRKLNDWAGIARQPQAPWGWLMGKLNGQVKETQKNLKTKNNTNKTKPFGLNIYGFAYGELGIGEDLRMAVECCEVAGIPYHVVNIDAGNTRQADRHLAGKIKELAPDEMPPYNTNLFCLPAFDTVSRVFMEKGAAVFEGYRNIGWWPWELAVFPKAWRPYAFELVDEVWASSQFLHEMYKEATSKPVKLVPLAVSVDRMKPYPRKHYGLPDKKFLYLYIFDFNSSVARKNPTAAVRAFKQAFEPKDNTVGLVLKTMNTKTNNIEWNSFLAECQTDKRIYLLKDTLNREEVLGLVNTCDAYLSLHRAEGFGRTLTEALILGKPVIATNYSGNVDFNVYTNVYTCEYKLELINTNEYQWIDQSDYAKWAEVSVESAKNNILKVRLLKNKSITNNNYFFLTTNVARKLKNLLF